MRGFSISEFQARTQKAQKEMAAEGIDCLLLTTEPEIRYFTGFLTRFWESPTHDENKQLLLRLIRPRQPGEKCA